MCVWKVEPEDRQCQFCSYRRGCERYPIIIKMDEQVAGRYVDAMKEVVGFDVLERTRRQVVVWARNLVAFRLHLDGYSFAAIGRLLGIHHATVLHACRHVDEMLEHPNWYRKECEIWTKFQEKLLL